MASNILVVDDQSNVRATIAYLLEKEGYRVTKAASGKEALQLLEEHEFEFALIDVKMAQMDGLELLRRIRARWPDVAVILMTAYASIPAAVDAVKMGAAHYLEKPFTKEKLLEAFDKVRTETGRGADRATAKGTRLQELVATSPALADAVELAQRAAGTDKPILTLGEFGSGRETLARAIHAGSPRGAASFLPVRCASIGDGLEAELFGSGPANAGRLVEANAGTLYLDEVAALPLELQGRLLRFLQDGEVFRESGAPTARSDARVIASSARDLDALVAEGAFRQDLFLRLKAVTIRVPPLRDRRGDLPKLVAHFARKHRPRGAPTPRFDRDAIRILMGLQFPGNLRELEDIVEQAVALAGGRDVTTDVLAKLDLHAVEEDSDSTHAMRTRVEQEEKKAIEEELRRNPRNLKQTAKNLNISRTTLWRKMRKYGLDGK